MLRSLALVFWLTIAVTASASEPPLVDVGVAKIEITPTEPVRLSGYGFRRAPHEGVIHPIWAKAIAIGDDASGPAVWLIVDATCIPEAVTDEVARRLSDKSAVRPDKFALSFTHTHTAPLIGDALATLFGEPVPPEHQAAVRRYTSELIDKLEQVAIAALAERKPSRLSWAVGKVDFAANRRTPGGPVDHSLPVLFVHSAEGALRGIVANYACHCTTLDDNLISGDWAGYAQIHIERAHPEAIAMISIGCGADSNPEPRRSHELAERHGASLAAEVERLLAGDRQPIRGSITAQRERIQLAFDTLPTRDEWEARAKQQDAVGYHARVQLARLDAGQALPTELGYTIQTWIFGDDLAMVFLPGEVVVDYELRLKKEYDPARLWVNAYSNDAPCYIPSRRIWEEGGYEGAGAMTYYDRPTRLAGDTEERIFAALARLLPKSFAAAASTSAVDPEFPPPLSPAESLAAMKLKPGFKAEIVACEPAIVDPVAIDFAADGSLWVVEMHDYPSGLDGNWKPGGRLKRLSDRDADGTYEHVETWADDLPFPTGVLGWKQGALVCAAPDVLYIADTNGDGRADVREALLTGFVTENYQARVNGLTYGLDNWIYGANGLLGGEIRLGQGEPVRLGARDFRFRPDEGRLEPAAGLTQQGRVRDDANNYFGGDNSTLLRHYPLPDHYLQRNPLVAAPAAGVYVPWQPDSNRVFPVSQTLQRFNDPDHAGRVTSGCGACIYRDDLLGAEYSGNAFICEPVHNLVTRLVLTPDGATFTGERAQDERTREFLASTDNWFRPVQTLTGTDGALYVVDMYRFVIEHPRWITPERLAKLDVRAGADKGRIYRIFREEKPPRAARPIAKSSVSKLIAELSNKNGPRRDLAQRELIRRKVDPAKLAPVVRDGKTSRQRLHALATLDGLGGLNPALILAAMADRDPTVRRHAARLSEPMARWQLSDDVRQQLVSRLIELTSDADGQVRLQATFSLGEFRAPPIGRALADTAWRCQDAYFGAAALSSVHDENLPDFVDELFVRLEPNEQFARLVTSAMEMSLAMGREDVFRKALGEIAARRETNRDFAWRTLAAALDALDRRGRSLEDVTAQQPVTGLDDLLKQAQQAAMSFAEPLESRERAMRLLGRRAEDRAAGLESLKSLLLQQTDNRLRTAAAATLARRSEDDAATVLLDAWPQLWPELRTELLDALLERESWALLLLERIESGEVAPHELDTARRTRLIEHPAPRVRERAAVILNVSPPVDRQLAVQRALSAFVHAGDAARGYQVFALKCGGCHQVKGQGHAVGPDLAALTDRSVMAFLTAVLDPNRAIDARYLAYTVATKDGRTLSGVLSAESATDVRLLAQDGKQQVILRSDVEAIQASSKSLMPEGLENEVSPTQLADLFAWLGATPPALKSAEGNKPETVRPDAEGALLLKASNCEVYGPTLQYMPEDDALGYWNSNDDYCLWSVDVPAAGKYEVSMEWSCDAACAENGFSVESRAGQLTGNVPSTETWQNHEQRSFGTLELDEGKQRVLFRADGPIKEALLDLRWVRLTPGGE